MKNTIIVLYFIDPCGAYGVTEAQTGAEALSMISLYRAAGYIFKSHYLAEAESA